LREDAGGKVSRTKHTDRTDIKKRVVTKRSDSFAALFWRSNLDLKKRDHFNMRV